MLSKINYFILRTYTSPGIQRKPKKSQLVLGEYCIFMNFTYKVRPESNSVFITGKVKNLSRT